MSDKYKFKRLTKKELIEMMQNGNITRAPLYKRVRLTEQQQKDAYDNVTYNIPLPKKSKRDKKPFSRERKIDKLFTSSIKKYTPQTIKPNKDKSNVQMSYFYVSIGYYFGTEDSNALDKHTVNESRMGYVSLDDFMNDYEHKIPSDMNGYDGTIKYISVKGGNYKKPTAQFFCRYNKDLEQWVEY